MLLQSVQRYKFESNSQLCASATIVTSSCCNQYKDTNLKAIHNGDATTERSEGVVAISTKIQIWKQFTTPKSNLKNDVVLLQSVQRYKFESNSQLKRNSSVTLSVVAISTKIQIWKQFTTYGLPRYYRDKLLQSVQRYKFESNSQLGVSAGKLRVRCCNQYKDTNLKAIHNSKSICLVNRLVVAISTKIQIWKQFTTDKRT